MQPKLKVPVIFKDSFTKFLNSSEPNKYCPFSSDIYNIDIKGCKLCNQLTGLSFYDFCPCHHFLDESLENFNLPDNYKSSYIKYYIRKNFARQFVCSLKNIQIEWIEDD